GTAVADQAGLGAIEMKAMVENGYKKSFSAALTLGSSVIGAIIPPSVPLIIYGFLAEVSIKEVFFAGVIPGLVIALALGIYVYIMVASGKVKAPPKEDFSAKKMFQSTQ